MSGRIVYFNGEFVPESEARVSIFDSSLMFGDMAFEVTRTFGGKPFRLEHHLDRLYASLRLLEIDPGMTAQKMYGLTLETLERNFPTEPLGMDWQIMHDVSRGPLSLYRSAFPRGVQPTVSINCWPLVTHMGHFRAELRIGRGRGDRGPAGVAGEPGGRQGEDAQPPALSDGGAAGGADG